MTWDGTRSDIGWINLALNANGGTGTCRYRYRDGRVTIQVNVTGAAIAIGSTPTTIVAAGAIPADLRPSVPEYTLANQGGNGIGFGVALPNGAIDVGIEAAATVPRSIVRFSVTYIPD